MIERGQRDLFCGHDLVAAGATGTRRRVPSAGAAKRRYGRKKRGDATESDARPSRVAGSVPLLSSAFGGVKSRSL